MKIAQVVCTYPPYRGGIGNVAHEYTERLRARGHHVHVFTPRYRRVMGDPEYVHRIPSPIHFGNAGVMPSLVSRLSGFDAVHLHYPFFGGAEPIIVRKAIRPNQPLVMTYHMDTVGKGLKSVMFDAHRRVLFPWIVERVDRILVSSREYADSSALHDLPGAADKIEILPFGVDIERFHPGEEPALRAKLEIPVDAPVLLFLGGLDPAHYFKGLSVLLEALDGLKELPWHLVVIGDGSLRPTYEATAELKGCRHRVHFLGSVSEEDKPAYYRMSDVHVFPSVDRSEAFGLVALEAGASGKPTIASSLPGVRGLVRHEETGLHVRPNDVMDLQHAVKRLLQDAGSRMRMGVSARRRVEESYAWDPLMDRLEGLFQQLAEGKRV